MSSNPAFSIGVGVNPLTDRNVIYHLAMISFLKYCFCCNTIIGS